MNVLLGLLDSAQPSPAQVPTRVIVARLLAAHTATCGTELGTEAALASTESWYQPEGEEGVGVDIVVVEEGGKEGIGVRNGTGGRRKDKVGSMSVKGQGRIAVG